MSSLTNLAFFRARSGQTQALGSALRALVDPTRAEAECNRHDPLGRWRVHDRLTTRLRD